MRNSVHRVLPVVLVAVLALASVSSASAEPATDTDRAAPASSAVVHDWERISLQTIYDPNAFSPIPVGVLYLGFTSLAMHQAVQLAGRARASQVAAAATAAHDVLSEYFPAAKAKLDAARDTSLASVPEGWAKRLGKEIGEQVADRLIKNRQDDGRNDTSIVYNKPAQPGIWQPQPIEMLAPWLGFVDPLVLRGRIRVDGPDPITTMAYAFDYQEVKRVGSLEGDRTQYQTDTALFFNSNSAIMVSDALLRYLDQNPLGLKETARLFALAHTAMADSIITCWRLKYDVGFWRPNQAIHGAADDGNPATIADPNWQSLLNTPPYSDYVSGHGCLTSPAIQAIRNTLGEETALTLDTDSDFPDRTYPNLSSIEFDAFHARIWGGLHFRDAMEDAYSIGHQTADRVERQLR